MAAASDVLFPVERPCEFFHTFDLYSVGAAERDKLVVEVLLAQRRYRGLKLGRRVRASDQQHLEQTVVGNDLLPEEIQRTGKCA